jgi:hypothetical protein
MTLIAAAGAALVALGVAFWRLGTTPLAKTMLVPLVVLGLLFASIGLSGYFANRRRIPEFEHAYREDATAFVRAEKARVEGFQYMYKITNILAPTCFALAVGLFWLTLNPRARAVGIALVLFGLFGLVIDGFSKERADLYYARVTEALAGPVASPTTSGSGGESQR